MTRRDTQRVLRRPLALVAYPRQVRDPALNLLDVAVDASNKRHGQDWLDNILPFRMLLSSAGCVSAHRSLGNYYFFWLPGLLLEEGCLGSVADLVLVEQKVVARAAAFLG